MLPYIQTLCVSAQENVGYLSSLLCEGNIQNLLFWLFWITQYNTADWKEKSVILLDQYFGKE
jgi:hypothetical protein